MNATLPTMIFKLIFQISSVLMPDSRLNLRIHTDYFTMYERVIGK